MSVRVMLKEAPQHSVLKGQCRLSAPTAFRSRSMLSGSSVRSKSMTRGGRTMRQP